VVTWTGDNTFEIGDVEFVCTPMLQGGFPSTPGRFCLVKPKSAVEAYERLLREREPHVIVEVGMYDGASVALFAEIARPDKLIGIDLRAVRSVALDDFIERRGLSGVVSAHYGIDQGDEAQVATVVDSALADRPVDLVIDDASHLLDKTRRTFNPPFPRVRPGGAYVIEDWWWAHATPAESILPDETPMTVLVFELVMACAAAPKIISRVTADHDWVIVERGSAPIDAASFDVSKCYGPRGRALLNDL